MEWFNKPPVIHSQTETSASFDVAPNTDFYRAADLSLVATSSPLYYKEVKGDFEIIAEYSANFHNLYDQAGPCIWLDDHFWIKSGFFFPLFIKILLKELKFTMGV
jgi:regulation of enolase protein 1 (concanavalin A-like superfamily)